MNPLNQQIVNKLLYVFYQYMYFISSRSIRVALLRIIGTELFLVNAIASLVDILSFYLQE